MHNRFGLRFEKRVFDTDWFADVVMQIAVADVSVSHNVDVREGVQKPAVMPAVPFVIGFIMGPMAETNLRRGLMLSDGNFMAFLANPIAATFLALAFVVWQIVSTLRPKKSAISEILRS